MGLRRKLRRQARRARAQNPSVQTPTNEGAADQSQGFGGKVGAFVQQAKALSQNQAQATQSQPAPASGFGQQIAAMQGRVQAQRAAPVAQPSGNPAPSGPGLAGQMQNQVAAAVEAQKGVADQGAGIQRRGNLATQGGFRR